MKKRAKAPAWKKLPDDERKIGNRLAYLRRHYNLKAHVFAEKIGLTPSQLASVEAGRVPLKIYAGWKACRELEIHPNWLRGGAVESPFPVMDEKVLRWAEARFERLKDLPFSQEWPAIAWFILDNSEEGRKFRAYAFRAMDKEK